MMKLEKLNLVNTILGLCSPTIHGFIPPHKVHLHMMFRNVQRKPCLRVFVTQGILVQFSNNLSCHQRWFIIIAIIPTLVCKHANRNTLNRLHFLLLWMKNNSSATHNFSFDISSFELHIPHGKVSRSSYANALCTFNRILQPSSLGLITNEAFVVYGKIIVLCTSLVQTLHDPYQSRSQLYPLDLETLNLEVVFLFDQIHSPSVNIWAISYIHLL